MSDDGHFWLQASINGLPRRFLVDTGATLTAISESTARPPACRAIDPPVGDAAHRQRQVQAELATIANCASATSSPAISTR
jgi:hypothetical protein